MMANKHRIASAGSAGAWDVAHPPCASRTEKARSIAGAGLLPFPGISCEKLEAASRSKECGTEKSGANGLGPIAILYSDSCNMITRRRNEKTKLPGNMRS
jgi:hypothetical protein